MVKSVKNNSSFSGEITFSRLLFYICMATLGFWLLVLTLEVAKWVAEIALVTGLVIVVILLIKQYLGQKGRSKK